MPTVTSFQEAIASAEGNKHALLGNGFSRACFENIFSYDALFDQANFEGLSDVARRAFAVLDTTDFEVVIRGLKQSAVLTAVYLEGSPEPRARMDADAIALRELLASTIAKSHPDRPAVINAEQYAACKKFLKNFDSIYTLNYDLLLYWALMQAEVEPEVRFDDGFRQPEDGAAEYVSWDTDKRYGQTLHYMHGALHIYDAGAELQKYTWCNTRIALIDQIRAALNRNNFPLFVAEGTAKSKLEKIEHSSYLSRAKRSFGAVKDNMFTFGFSFGPTDEHILTALAKGTVKRAFISLYGDPNSEANRTIVQRAEHVAARRPRTRPLALAYYDADSAGVWG
jgi:hypothetical protein